MKFETQVQDSVPRLKNTKSEIYFEIQDGGCRHIGFHINRHNSAKYEPIFMKFETQV